MRLVQILNGKAHWTFEAEQCPEFAPDIVIRDISANPEVQEGWSYDAETDSFSSPPVPSPVTIEEPVDEEKVMLCESVIALSDEIEQLKARIQTLEGGV